MRRPDPGFPQVVGAGRAQADCCWVCCSHSLNVRLVISKAGKTIAVSNYKFVLFSK